MRLSFKPKAIRHLEHGPRSAALFENLQVLQPSNSQSPITAAGSTSAGHDSTSADWLGPAHVSAGAACRAADRHGSRFIAGWLRFFTTPR
jgi:hypothetical protein